MISMSLHKGRIRNDVSENATVPFLVFLKYSVPFFSIFFVLFCVHSQYRLIT